MSEKHSNKTERSTEALENAAAERSAELKRLQHTGEKLNEQEQRLSLEKARSEANSEALLTKEHSSEHKNNSDGSKEQVPKVITSQERATSFKSTMREIRKDMNPAEKTFSKIIHTPFVERISDTVGNTIARPNAILYGSIFAFIGVVAIYMYARFIGFALSGFETIAAFIIGWVVGLLVDFFRVMISGKKR